MLGQPGVSAQCRGQFGAEQREQPGEFRDTAADHDPLGRGRVDDVAQPGGQVGRLQPQRLAQCVAGQFFGRGPPAGAHRPEPLPAVTVEGAGAGEGVARDPGHREVAHLGVDQPADHSAADHRAAADPGADGEVDVGVQALRRAPAALAEGRAVDVGVDAHRHSGGRDRTGDVHPGPAGFGGGGEVAEPGMARAQFEGTEGGDADRVQRTGLGGRLLEEGDGPGQGGARFAGREPDLGLDPVGGRADQADELGPARLDRPEARRAHAPTGQPSAPTGPECERMTTLRAS